MAKIIQELVRDLPTSEEQISKTKARLAGRNITRLAITGPPGSAAEILAQKLGQTEVVHLDSHRDVLAATLHGGVAGILLTESEREGPARDDQDPSRSTVAAIQASHTETLASVRLPIEGNQTILAVVAAKL